MEIKPLQNWVVVMPDLAEEKTSGGLVIPESAQEKPEHGKVLAVGEGRFVEEKNKKGKSSEKKIEKQFVPTVVKSGDHVLYEKYGAKRIAINDVERVLVREEDILGYWDI